MTTADYQSHPLADRYPLMGGEEYEAFLADVRANGVRNPVWMYGGMVLDGRNRLRACLELGIEPVLVEFEGTEEEAAAFVESQNLHRRHLSAEWRRQRVAELRAKGMSTREIARQVGTSHMTVARDVKENEQGVTPVTPEPPAPAEPPPVVVGELIDTAPPPPSKVTGRDGKQYPASKPVSPPPSEPKPRPKQQPPAREPEPSADWQSVVSHLTRLADALDGVPTTPNEGVDPCKLVKSMEATGRALLRKANDIRRKLHL